MKTLASTTPTFLLIFLLLTVSCSSSKEKKSSSTSTEIAPAVININVEEQIKKSLFIDDLVDEVEYLPLQTTTESLIGTVDKVEITDSLIFILDAGKALFIFDHKGNFINKIARQGKGPGEYIKMLDFNYCKRDSSLMICDINRKVLKFDVNGNFISSWRHSFQVDKIVNLGMDRYIVHNGMDYQSFTKNDPYSHKIVSQGEVTDSFFEVPKYLWGVSFGEGIFTQSKNIFLKPFFSNTIYQYEDSLIAKYNINFINRNIDVETLSVNKKSIGSPLEILKSIIVDNNRCGGISDIVENRNYLFFSFMAMEGVTNKNYLSGNPINCLYSLKDSSCKVFKHLISSKYIFNPISSYNDFFVSVVQPYSIVEDRDDLPEEMRTLFADISSEDNPVLVFYKLKENQ